ncbi:MAG: OmpA family protein [Gammaproteobacteria bacterium]|nr:OmpA family protein [Gammaproteobacteria bacterium]MDH5304781.1 OmpA family protein [Gammaproteobacteria bacterium]MDH5323059.1 OmpA family protein [Gammaproteobacteria bacterium]
MNTLARRLLPCCLLLAGTVLADEGDKYFYIEGSYLDPETALPLDSGAGLQLGIGGELNRLLNLEGYLRSSSTGGSPKLKSTGIGADLQFVFNRDGRFQPFLFTGFGYQDTRATGDSSVDGGVLTGGAGFRSQLGSGRTSVRGEFRYNAFNAYGLHIDEQLYSLGLEFAFGKKSPPPVVPMQVRDSDGDGVADETDECPGTPAGIGVNRAGCPLDGDGDGVADYMDECPGTVRGAAVDARGCELDGDKDGVVDRLDQCPDTRAGAQVDINGCEIREEIRLPGVNFESNSDRLLPSAASVLNDAAETLLRNPSIRVEVAGHSDSDGSAEYNESLSARRAATVRDYLITGGVNADRITTRGYGESQPIASNATAEGKATNRRVVLRVTAR